MEQTKVQTKVNIIFAMCPRKQHLDKAVKTAILILNEEFRNYVPVAVDKVALSDKHETKSYVLE